MEIQNVSSKKKYHVTREQYERNFKGKENWIVTDEKDNEEIQGQLVSNTIGKKNSTKIATEKSKNKKNK